MKCKDLIKGKRYWFYMNFNEHKHKVSALYTGEKDSNNGNYIFMYNNELYSIPRQHVFRNK